MWSAWIIFENLSMPFDKIFLKKFFIFDCFFYFVCLYSLRCYNEHLVKQDTLTKQIFVLEGGPFQVQKLGTQHLIPILCRMTGNMNFKENFGYDETGFYSSITPKPRPKVEVRLWLEDFRTAKTLLPLMWFGRISALKQSLEKIQKSKGKKFNRKRCGFSGHHAQV